MLRVIKGKRNMLSWFSKSGLGIVMVLLISLVITGCGRRGALEAPPSTVVTSDDIGEETSEEPVKEDKPFILDRLL